MAFEDPIIILACPRSGSSMTAGLFHHHGVWSGTSRGGNENNPKGYFEHTLLKKQLKKEWGLDLFKLSINPPEYKEDFKDKVKIILEKDGYPNGKWLYKHSALYWRAWGDFKPKYILVRRDLDQTVQSNIDVGFHRGKWSRDELTEIMKAHHREMDIVEKEHGGCNVYTDELVQGNYTSLEKALSYAEIDFNPQMTKDFITPAYWKHHAKHNR